MLASALGIRLILWAGKTIPTPVPYPLTSTISRVEVQNNDGDDHDGFQITFTVGRSAASYTRPLEDLLAPFNRVIIGVLLGAMPHVLIDGVITHHQVTPSMEPGGATLTVTGKDISYMMDLAEQTQPYEDQSDGDYATQVLGRYPALNLVVQEVTRSGKRYSDRQWQLETNLHCLRRLAARSDFDFYVEPVTFLVNRVYFGPRERTGVRLPPLAFNVGTATNVSSLHFSQDGAAPFGVEYSFVAPDGKTVISMPAVTPPRLPALSARVVAAARTRIARHAASLGSEEALLAALAMAGESPDAVTGEGELDTVRYGAVLRSRRLVAVRGAGDEYNGTYCVRRVSHNIERGRYTQGFSLGRDGTGNLLPTAF